jgi:putative membrane protein
MVIYNPKDWWKLIFAFQKSDTFRMMLPGIFGVAAYTALIVWLENDLLQVGFKNTTVIHSLVGFVLSLMLVFRTNSAYERWWEGRKIWGSFVNNSRNLALKIATMVEDPMVRNRFRVLIPNYIYAAKEHLRQGPDIAQMQEVDGYPLSYYQQSEHVPNQVMKAMYQEVQLLVKSGQISMEQMLYINNELQSFTDNIGACERIRKTPIPYSYNIFLKKVIFLYIFTMPIGFAREFGYWSAPIVAILFYIFASIELIAEEIEDPFGRDANDLPTDTIYETIKANVAEILA